MLIYHYLNQTSKLRKCRLRKNIATPRTWDSACEGEGGGNWAEETRGEKGSKLPGAGSGRGGDGRGQWEQVDAYAVESLLSYV